MEISDPQAPARAALTPAWYVGPGVYVREGGSFVLWMDGAETTIDEVLMLWDPAPSVEQ